MTIVKCAKTVLFFLITTVLLISALPAHAADYTITIDQNGLSRNQDSIFRYNNAGSNDEFIHDIVISNLDTSAYVVRLKDIEILENSILLDKMSFAFTNIFGGENIFFTKDDFDTIGHPEMYVSSQNSSGRFQLKTSIGNLTNEYQNTSVAIRYVFEITRLYGDFPRNDPPKTGDFTDAFALWTAFGICALAIVFLLFFYKRKKEEENEDTTPEEGNITTAKEELNMTETATDTMPQEDQPQKGKIKKIILNIAMGLAMLVMVFAIISVFFFNQEDMYLFGYKPYVISSESMEPVYMKNCVVIIKKDTYDDVKVGDLIAFKAQKIGGQPAFHRVIKITENGFVTKGDAVKQIDEQIVTREHFLGSEAWHTNVTATLIPLVQTPMGFVMIVVLPILLIAVIIIIVRMIRRR